VQNEQVFRRVNERLREDWDRLGIDPGSDALFLCECGDAACREPIRIPTTAYEAVRDDPDAFIIVPGHEDTAVETVIEDLTDPAGRYAIVHKHERPA